MNIDAIRAILREIRDSMVADDAVLNGWADRIEAALTGADGAGWQPIETAPKDGTWVLTRFTDGRCDVLRWSVNTLLKNPRWRDAEYFHYEPTAWRPLP